MPSFQQSPPAAEALPTAALRLPPLPDGLAGVRVRRSTRRRKTVSARLEAGEIVVFLPCGLSTSQEQEWVNRMVERVVTKRARPARSDEELARRADEIATRLRRVDPADLEDVTDGVRIELDDLLERVHSGLRELSGAITAAQLSLPGGMQPLWGPDERRLVP